MLIGPIGCRSRVVEVDRSIVAVFISAGQAAYRVFRNRRLHGPLKGFDWTDYKHRRLAVPADLTQNTLAVRGGFGLEGPGGVGSQLRRNSHFTQDGA